MANSGWERWQDAERCPNGRGASLQMVEEMLDDLLAAHLCDHFGEDILAGSAEEGYGAPKAGSLLVVRLLIGRTAERGQDRTSIGYQPERSAFHHVLVTLS